MSTTPNENQVQDPAKAEAIEKNLSKQRQMYEKMLENERVARQRAEDSLAAAERASQERSKQSPLNEDEDDDEPYIDKRKLQKTLNKFGEQTKQQTQQDIQHAVQTALSEERRSNYLKENSDFNEIMKEETIEKFANKYPKLAENILRMPEGFERNKLVYENIKALGVDKPEQKQSAIQDKIDANKKNPYYQPSGVGSAAYASQGDFSKSGQKNAYEKMQELKSRLRI